MLPPYEYQWPVDIDGHQHYIDFAYPDVRLAIEVDGYAKRDSRQALEHDDARQNRLLRAGWRVLRFTWHNVVHEPAAVAAEILATLSDLSYRFGR
jgi:very-short-patch-repair endonuclease